MKSFHFGFAWRTFFFAMLAIAVLGIGFESQAHAVWFFGYTGVDILDYMLDAFYCSANPMMGC